MGMIQRIRKIDSLSIDINFLKEIEKIFSSVNKNIRTKTIYVVKSEDETSKSEDLKDFVESIRILPETVDNISIKIVPVNFKQKKEIIQLHLNLENNNPYYSIIGYDDGKLSTIEKKLTSLLKEYSSDYYFIHKYNSKEGSIIELLLIISSTFLFYRILSLSSNSFIIEYLPIFTIAFFIISARYISKYYEKAFPFIELNFESNKKNLSRTTIVSIFLGLTINLIWEGIKFLM